MVRKYWPLAVAIVVLLYVWLGKEEPVIVQEQQAEMPVSPPVSMPPPTLQQPSPWDTQTGRQAPATAYERAPYGYPQPRDRSAEPSYLQKQYQFRPREQEEDQYQRYPAPAVVPQPQLGQEYTYPQPVPSYQAPMEWTAPQAPQDMGYSFRPLDRKKQSRRWQGNYPQRYTPPPSQLVNPRPPQGNYPSSTNPAGSGFTDDSLWANSWPAR